MIGKREKRFSHLHFQTSPQIPSRVNRSLDAVVVIYAALIVFSDSILQGSMMHRAAKVQPRAQKAFQAQKASKQVALHC
jgi:hypothetical protein